VALMYGTRLFWNHLQPTNVQIKWHNVALAIVPPIPLNIDALSFEHIRLD